MRYKNFLLEAEEKIEYRVLTWDELCELIDHNFKDLISRLKYVNGDQSEWRSKEHIIYIAAFVKKKIIGLLKLSRNNVHDTQKEKGMYYVTVDPKFKNQKIGTTLLKKMFELAAQKKFSIHLSSYTKEGKQFAYSTIERLKKEFPDVKIFDSDFHGWE